MSTLTADQLFTPAPSGVLAANPGGTPASGTWLAQILANAATLGLETTAWQSGQPSRTICAILAVLQSQQDGIVSAMNQGGFLDFAATGTWTVIDVNGNPVTNPVTPDPTIPSQVPTTGWTPGFLDALADSVYDVQRIGAQAAAGTEYAANMSGNTYNFVDGSWHIQDSGSGATYHNVGALVIPPTGIAGTGGVVVGASNTSPIQVTTQSAHGLTSGAAVYIVGSLGNVAANGWHVITVTGTTTFNLSNTTGSGAWTSGGNVFTAVAANIQADLVGTQSTAVAGAIDTLVTQSTGVVVVNPSALIGTPYEGNVSLAQRCRAKLASVSPMGPSQAYDYFARTAGQVLAELSPPAALTLPISRPTSVVVNPATGVVTLTVANALGAVAGTATPIAVTNATNASPIQITTSGAHGLATGDYVWVTAVAGNTAANGVRAVTVVDGTNFQLNGSQGNGTYTASTGKVETKDLGLIDFVIQTNVVPDAVTATTQTVIDQTFTPAGTITVPAALVATYTAAMQNALTIYYENLPIGGVGGYFQIDTLIGVLFAAGTANGQNYIAGMTGITVNGSASNVAYTGSNYVAILPISNPFSGLTVVGQ